MPNRPAYMRTNRTNRRLQRLIERGSLVRRDRDFLERLERYEDIAPRLREQRQVVEYFDLRFGGDRIWVK